MLKYEELCRTLLDELDRGVYQKGERLPTTPELCRIYGVSNTTVKRAMDELEQLGVVARRRGSGVYIKQTQLPDSRNGARSTFSTQMSGFIAEYQVDGNVVSSKVIDFSVVAPPDEICDALNLESDEFVYQICRIRLINDEPKVIEYTYMPLGLIPGLRRAHLEKSIYAYIEGDLKLKIGSAHRAIKAVMPTANERKWMQLDKHSPLLEVRQIAYLADGTPFEHSIARHTSDYEFYSVSTCG